MTDNDPDTTDYTLWAPGLRRLITFRTLVHVAFWSWHAVWILGMVFGLGPHLLPVLIVGSFTGEIPWGITLSALGLAGFPFVTVMAGWSVRDDHRRLFALFYGVAGVGLSLLIVRLFLVREMTPGVAFLLVTLGVGAAFYSADLFGRPSTRTLRAALVSMVGYAALLIIGVWIGAAMGLYCVPAIPLVVQAIPGVFVEIVRECDDPGFWLFLPIVLGVGAFVACCGVVVIGLPFAVIVLYSRAWWRGLCAWCEHRSAASGLLVTGATVAAWLVGFVVVSEQPQVDAFARLDHAPAGRAEQADHADHADEIQDGLLNAYLAPYRYWGANGNNVQLARMARDAFGADEDVMVLQDIFDVLAAPLLYDGPSTRGDQQRAALAYERFFDRPLQDGDREAVMTAVTATFDRSEAEAGLLDVGNRNVLLREQDLRTTIAGDVAHFELHESYENQTHEPQEVFYYFNLPERAAITGLWLSAGPKPVREFAYTVAPRGAAQAVYREQVRRRVDPALIERVGPRQYRLRVFPIPTERSGVEPVMHLWMEWSALADGDGWALPRLAQARNVYWDEDDTRRTIDGAVSDHDGWLPERISAQVTAQQHELVIGEHRVRATPASDHAADPIDGRLAVVVDTSRSMGAHALEVTATLGALVARGIAFDLYTAPSPWSADRPQRVTIADFDPRYYGGHSHEGVLADFAAARNDVDYAAVIVLTDAGSFAFAQAARPTADRVELDAIAHAKGTLEALAAAQWRQPIWMLHLGGLPHAYRDELTAIIGRTKGGVATDLDTLLTRMSSPVIDGYIWEFDAAPAVAEIASDAFAPIAAAALIAHLGDRGADLDAIHRLAMDYSVVTPWSSMIVLVTDQQKEALEKASKADDRFDREAESGVESTTAPGAALEVSGTPEPHEWMLLALAGLGLLGIARGRRPGRECTSALG